MFTYHKYVCDNCKTEFTSIFRDRVYCSRKCSSDHRRGAKMKKKLTLKERFEQKFRVTPGCWEWTASMHERGYGKIKVDGKLITASRLSYELYVGKIEEGMFILHNCDNPRCVNPAHLRQGTNQDNCNDIKERNPVVIQYGVAKPRVRITEEIVRRIRQDNRPQKVIANELGISTGQVSNIRTKKIWSQV